MPVDMSPERIWGRLVRVDQLWELTATLKQIGKSPAEKVEQIGSSEVEKSCEDNSRLTEDR